MLAPVKNKQILCDVSLLLRYKQQKPVQRYHPKITLFFIVLNVSSPSAVLKNYTLETGLIIFIPFAIRLILSMRSKSNIFPTVVVSNCIAMIQFFSWPPTFDDNPRKNMGLILHFAEPNSYIASMSSAGGFC